MFSSLTGYNYRLWFSAALISNVGMWMQRTAQDWIVLTELTDNDASALGLNLALQFAPPLLLFPVAGLIADRVDRRKMLIVTQAASAALAAALAVIVLLDVAVLWHLWAFSFTLGVVAAIDNPVRQAFVSELVGRSQLQNAVSLNSASFNVARLIGPAVAGGLVALIGSGWVFAVSVVTYAATIGSLFIMRRAELHPEARAPRARGQILEGFRYVRRRSDLLVLMLAIFVFGTFGLNFPIYTATMTSVEFGLGAGAFGLLSSVLAIGSVIGALMAARRERPRLRMVYGGAAAFSVSCVIAALMPTYLTFAISLVLVGFTSITILTTANATVQTTTAAGMRGRVVALYFAIMLGGTIVGAPLIGWVADVFGPRWALLVGGSSGFVAAAIGLIWMVTAHDLRVRYDRDRRSRFVVSHDRSEPDEEVVDLTGPIKLKL